MTDSDNRSQQDPRLNGSNQTRGAGQSNNRSYDASRYSRAAYESGTRSNNGRRAAQNARQAAPQQQQQQQRRQAARQQQGVRGQQAARGQQPQRAQQGQRKVQPNAMTRQQARGGVPQQQRGANQYSRDNGAYAQRKKKSPLKGIIIGVIVAVVVVFAGYQLVHALYIDQINKQLQGGKSSEELQAIQDALGDYSDETFSEPFYAMLIGSDERDAGSDVEGARSDTNIVIRIDAVNKVITMVSIPRDTMIELDDYGTQKFNAAYQFGGAALTISEAKKITGADISHYASVNFDGLTDLVDAVGGVDVQVDELIDDPDAGDVVIEPGLQHLDGEAALVFARSRSYTDGDFSRVANQRKLIAAIIDKVMTLPAAEMINVISAASACVTTDMDVHSIQALAQQLRKGDSTPTIYSATIPSSAEYIGGVSYVIHDASATAEMMAIVDAGGDPSTVATLSSVEQEGLANAEATTEEEDEAA